MPIEIAPIIREPLPWFDYPHCCDRSDEGARGNEWSMDRETAFCEHCWNLITVYHLTVPYGQTIAGRVSAGFKRLCKPEISRNQPTVQNYATTSACLLAHEPLELQCCCVCLPFGSVSIFLWITSSQVSDTFHCNNGWIMLAKTHTCNS